MVVRKKLDSHETEMRLTGLLDDLGLTLDELDSYEQPCGCCYAPAVMDRDNAWGLIAEIEGLRFLLDV